MLNLVYKYCFQCSENTDCCSNKCGRGAGKYYHACVLNPNDSFDKKFSELTPIIRKPAVCIMPGHFVSN